MFRPRLSLLLRVAFLVLWTLVVISLRDAFLVLFPNQTANPGLNTDRAFLEAFHGRLVIPPRNLIGVGVGVEGDWKEEDNVIEPVGGNRMCHHPMEGKMDVVNFHGVGGNTTSFRRKFSAMSRPNLGLWLNFYFCDAPGVKVDGGRMRFHIKLRAFILQGLRFELYDVFGRLYHSITIYRSLRYIVNHHQDEETLRQEKLVWKDINYIDEFLSELTLTYSQDLTKISPDGRRTTDVLVSVRGTQMPLYSFQSLHSLEIIQSAMLDCVSFKFDCSEVTEVEFTGLTPRTRRQDVLFQLQHFSHFKAQIENTAQLVRGRTGDLTAHVPADRRGTPGGLRLVVGVMSSPARFEFRLAQRRTFMTHPLVRSGAVVIKFFLSASPSVLLTRIMDEEAQVFDDMILLPEGEVYLTISYKVEKIFNYFTSPEWDHDGPVIIGKSDDDTYTDVEALYRQLQSKHEPDAIYGRRTNLRIPHSLTWHWFTADTREYSVRTMSYMIGIFYAVNAELARSWLSPEEQSGWLMWNQMEDRQTGLWVRHFRKTTGRTIRDVVVDGLEERCVSGVVILHHVVPLSMDCLYDTQKAKGTFTCCPDLENVWH